jgi:cytochrome b6-f complex iron-sulfur subunit
MAKKLTTEEILKMARASKAGSSDDAPAEPASDAAPAEDSAPAAEPAKPAAAPKGPADIMAAIRAKGAGGADNASSSEAEAKPAAAAAPQSPADIMAAIRGKGAGAAPAAAKPAAKKAATDVPAGDLPSVGEMLAQLKAGRKPAAADAPAKPTLKLPARPAPKVAPQPTRRSFLLDAMISPFALAWTVLAATTGAWVLMLARFMFPNMIVEPPTSFKIGPPSEFPLGTVSTKYTAANGIWIVHTDQYKGKDLIYVLASVCTHLGCTPSWLEGEQKFKCPCHGSGFYINGINFEGPAPRPLERMGVALAPDGTLEVDKAVKFQEEKGQWEDDKSFVDGSLA